jgi:hypothetical protein
VWVHHGHVICPKKNKSGGIALNVSYKFLDKDYIKITISQSFSLCQQNAPPLQLE